MLSSHHLLLGTVCCVQYVEAAQPNLCCACGSSLTQTDAARGVPASTPEKPTKISIVHIHSIRQPNVMSAFILHMHGHVDCAVCRVHVDNVRAVACINSPAHQPASQLLPPLLKLPLNTNCT
jgi:hypothetical protein